MFEKFLLAITITFSLNLFLGLGVQSTAQPTITAQLSDQPFYLAKALLDRGFLRDLSE